MVKSILSTIFATVAVTGAIVTGEADVQLVGSGGCEQQCRSEHNQCRLAAKTLSAPQCDSQLNACLASCRGSKR
jgi:hypothetical protein